jgi:hypothetical protein
MKKIFTLLFTVGSLTAAVAQSHQESYGRQDGHDADRRYEAYNSYNARERDQQIARINMEFDAKIRDIKYDRFSRQNQKRRQIERLEFERSQQIKAINERLADRRDRYAGSYAYGRH